VEKAGGDIRSIAEDMRGTTMTAPQAAKEAPPEQKTTPTITQEAAEALVGATDETTLKYQLDHSIGLSRLLR